MTSHLTQRLAARTVTRQVEASLLADQVADHVDRVIASHLRQVFRPTPIIAQAQYHAHAMFANLVPIAVQAMRTALVRLTRWGHRSAVDNLRRTLPRTYLDAAARGRLGLLEAEPMYSVSQTSGPKEQPGELEMIMRILGLEPAEAPFFGQIAREPASRRLTAEQAKEAFIAWLFPPPPPEQINRIVQGSGWERRLEASTRLAPPQRVAAIVSQGIAQGKLPREIAKDLLPVVDSVRSTARRIARTEAIRVANEAQFEASKGLGDLVIGYQIHAVLDSHTRSTHAARNGQIYYVNPKPGQRGLDQMPRPPLEADGTVAFNCRCTTSPVLAPPPHLKNMPLFTTAQNKVIGDPQTYSEWWQTANERKRRMVVGTRRYSLGREILGADPEWEFFVDPDGGMLDMATLRGESGEERGERIGRVRAAMGDRREMMRRVLAGQAV